jgi:hypothetical protein
MWQVIISMQTNQLLELCLILWFVHAHEISDTHNQPAIRIDVCHLIIAGESHLNVAGHHINSDQPAFGVMLDFVACAFS